MYCTDLCVERLGRNGPFGKKVGYRCARGAKKASLANLAGKERHFGTGGDAKMCGFSKSSNEHIAQIRVSSG
jgi:hypothetical protein